MLDIGINREQHEKIFLSETTRPRALIFGMSIIEWTSTKFDQIIAMWSKMACLGGHMFYIGLYREQHEKILLSETTWPRALIFGMKYHLVVL